MMVNIEFALIRSSPFSVLAPQNLAPGVMLCYLASMVTLWCLQQLFQIRILGVRVPFM